MFPNFEGFTNKIGVTTSVVKTNKFSDFGNLMRPLNNDDKGLMQMMITRGYYLSVDRCSEGRNTTRVQIEKVAEGRILSGEMAKELGWVGELGGMYRTLDIAVA